jgi:hypothetical protein
MFYDIGRKLAFIHVPRSAGCSISLSYVPYLTLGGCIDLAHGRHLAIRGLKARLGHDANKMTFFAVKRDFDEIFESFIKFVGRERELLKDETNEINFSFEWKSLLLLDISDEALTRLIWYRNRWPITKDEWNKYWFDHDNLIVLNYYDLQNEWDAFCDEYIGFRIPLLKVN